MTANVYITAQTTHVMLTFADAILKGTPPVVRSRRNTIPKKGTNFTVEARRNQSIENRKYFENHLGHMTGKKNDR
jgi:hypothetical protein